MHVNFSNPTNVVAFCESYFNKAELEKIKKEGKESGLSYTNVLSEQLSHGNYIPVLKAIWSEENPERKITWLRTCALTQLHGPLMFELAVEEFAHDPRPVVLNARSLPLIKAAAFRVQQDAKCSKDASVYNGDAHARMFGAYVARLNELTQKFLGMTPRQAESLVQPDPNYSLATIASRSLTVELPSPVWIKNHGMAFFLKEEGPMHPEADFKRIRDAYAHEELTRLQK